MNLDEFDSPFKYCPELKEEYLEEIAKAMLKVVEGTLNDISTPLDDNYTLETCIFGRIRQMFLALDKDTNKPYIKVASPTMDYVPRICNIPVRVFKDDPVTPKKQKVFYRNECEQHQLSLLEEDDNSDASNITWRLFIQSPATVDDKGEELEDLEDDYRVVLVGYSTTTNAIKAVWQSQASVKEQIHLVSDELPLAQQVAKRNIVPKGNDIKTANGDE